MHVSVLQCSTCTLNNQMNDNNNNNNNSKILVLKTNDLIGFTLLDISDNASSWSKQNC